jgi:hypothetical protein
MTSVKRGTGKNLWKRVVIRILIAILIFVLLIFKTSKGTPPFIKQALFLRYQYIILA